MQTTTCEPRSRLEARTAGQFRTFPGALPARFRSVSINLFSFSRPMQRRRGLRNKRQIGRYRLSSQSPVSINVLIPRTKKKKKKTLGLGNSSYRDDTTGPEAGGDFLFVSLPTRLDRVMPSLRANRKNKMNQRHVGEEEEKKNCSNWTQNALVNIKQQMKFAVKKKKTC